MTTISSERVRCAVPGCHRTHAPFEDGSSEWICGKHWDAIPKTYRRVHYRFRRRFKAGRLSSNSIRLWNERIWERLKRVAIERAAGIG